MTSRSISAALGAIAFGTLFVATPAFVQGNGELKEPGAFNGVSDTSVRSRAIFAEMGKVLQSPRCLNCHPVHGGPTQGDDMHTHVPPVVRGDADFGVAGMTCNTCHGPANVAFSNGEKSVPGNMAWHLAPESMGWQGLTLGQICMHLKDRKLNGDRDLEALYTHMAADTLVGWAWKPGQGRASVVGDQMGFGRLVRAWIDTGAICPE